ncbi:MAG: hypothetical protein SNG49_06890 [Rikenellaceae bacterium]
MEQKCAEGEQPNGLQNKYIPVIREIAEFASGILIQNPIGLSTIGNM